MSANITSVYGFFYQQGSSDFPVNMSYKSAFGFDAGSTTAVFKYSIDDVINSIDSPRDLNVDGYYNTDRRSVFTVDGTINTSIADEDMKSAQWIKVFRILEYLYNNQSSISGAASSSSYSCYGDEMLTRAIKANSTDANPYYIDSYTPKSLTYEISSHAGRLRYVSFTVAMSYGVITVTSYFDADAFVERSSGIRYQVYRYVDSDNNSTISQTEFDANIIKKVFDILASGEFNSYGTFYTNKRTGESSYVTEQFFVFTSLKTTISDSIKKTKVKAYLIDYYNNDLTYLYYTYPDLFDEDVVTLIPAYENTYTTAGGTIKDLYSLSISKLKTILSSYGFSVNETDSTYKPAEIFHVGPGTGYAVTNGSRNSYVYPIIAVETDPESGITLPISSRFVDYVPIYGSQETTDMATFHSLVLTMLDYLTGVTNAIDGTIVSNREVNIYAAKASSYNRKYITFKFNSTLWQIYGPTTTV